MCKNTLENSIYSRQVYSFDSQFCFLWLLDKPLICPPVYLHDLRYSLLKLTLCSPYSDTLSRVPWSSLTNRIIASFFCQVRMMAAKNCRQMQGSRATQSGKNRLVNETIVDEKPKTSLEGAIPSGTRQLARCLC
jgi:hypothetical protein